MAKITKKLENQDYLEFYATINSIDYYVRLEWSNKEQRYFVQDSLPIFDKDHYALDKMPFRIGNEIEREIREAVPITDIGIYETEKRLHELIKRM